LVTFIRQTMLLYNGALVILKQVISLNVCAMSTVLIYMIICDLVACVISFDYSFNSLYFSPLSSSLWFAFVLVFYAVLYIFCHVYLRGEINVYIFAPVGTARRRHPYNPRNTF